MRALTFQGRQAIACESVPDPTLQSPGDALVRVGVAGICGSDLHAYHERETGLDHGAVMGHEFVGEVLEVGREVEGIAAGDRVLSPFTTSCGDCFYCRSGLSARCARGQLFGWVQDGQGLQGAQAEYVRVPLAGGTLVKVPEEVDDDVALLLGDILATGYYCALRADIEPGGTYAVVGCGPVGLMAVIGARELGAEKLYAIDSIPERLALAERFGAIPLDFTATDAVATLREVTDGRGADAVLEVVGSPAATRVAVDLLRPGGTLSAVGVHTEQHLDFSPAEAYDKNLTFRIGRCPVRSLLDRLIPLARKHKYDYGAVISHRLPLDDGAAGYRIFDRKEDGCTKVVLTP